MSGEMIKHVHKELCKMIFTVALIIKMKNLKQPKCYLIREWVNKLYSTHTMEDNT